MTKWILILLYLVFTVTPANCFISNIFSNELMQTQDRNSQFHDHHRSSLFLIQCEIFPLSISRRSDTDHLGSGVDCCAKPSSSSFSWSSFSSSVLPSKGRGGGGGFSFTGTGWAAQTAGGGGAPRGAAAPSRHLQLMRMVPAGLLFRGTEARVLTQNTPVGLYMSSGRVHPSLQEKICFFWGGGEGTSGITGLFRFNRVQDSRQKWIGWMDILLLICCWTLILEEEVLWNIDSYDS